MSKHNPSRVNFKSHDLFIACDNFAFAKITCYLFGNQFLNERNILKRDFQSQFSRLLILFVIKVSQHFNQLSLKLGSQKYKLILQLPNISKYFF